MGRAVLRLCAEREDCRVVGAIAARQPAQRVVDGVPHFAAAEIGGAPDFDVAIDFSLPAGFDAILAACLVRGAGLVSGTTGLSGAQHAALQDAGARIGVLWSAHFSLGVALLEELVRSEEHTSELPSLMRISYAVFCLQ